MELILATRDGREICVVPYDVDMEAGGENNFVIEIPRSAWSGYYTFDSLVYIAGTEFGGIIGEVETMNDPEMVYCKGYLWRGLLSKKIIQPAPGMDYYTVSGDANACIRQVINDFYNDPLMRGSSETAGVNISSYSFDRYTDILSGLTKMLVTKGYRLDIRYIYEGTGGYVEISAVPVVNYESTIEFSEDDEITIVADEIRNGVNHLICLGQGELAQRTVVHLYADASGTISTTQTFFGRDEITEVFDDTSAETTADLIQYGKNRFDEIISKTFFDASAGHIDATLQIGDIVSGRDYTTGINVVRPIERKILTITNEIENIEYRLEGES